MRERPILFSAAMVRAILRGEKNQTRRVVKPQPFSNGFKYDRDIGDIACHDDFLPPSAMLLRAGTKKHPYNATQDEWLTMCPYGQPGDRLWARESFAQACKTICREDETGERDYHNLWHGPVSYLADGPAPDGMSGRPSIHMPRWASRLTLDVTSVRVERLQSISPRDAWDEGVRCSCTAPTPICAGNIEAFRTLWRSINGAESWDANPWVWCVSFKRVDSLEGSKG